MKKYLLTLIIGVFSITAFAQSLEDSVALEAFMDGVIKTHLNEKKIAGATLAIIQNGKIILKKGYGYSDLATKKPVDPDLTMFRIGSISKMFVWISVMQLVAEGKLDLNKDINAYLKDFQIPSTYDQPITLKHLMTHTPGFEDLVLNLFGKDSSTLAPLSEILKKEIPARVRTPYTQASYSNHGTGIAAHIVELVSGMTFLDYVQQKIITPLKMSSTTFDQPIPGRLQKQMSEGYKVVNHAPEKQGFEYVPLYPVGAAAASAENMTHFMMALLQNGKYEDYQLLDSATLELMKSPAHRQHPNVNPMRYGFMDVSQNGYTVIGHGGDTFWFHSLMALLPDEQTGIFLSFNTDAGGGVYMKVLESFMDEYFPEKNHLAPPMKVTKSWLQQFAGEYMGNRYPYKDLVKISSLFGRIHINVVDSTKIRVVSDNDNTVYVPIDSTTFREENSSETLAFSKNEEGKVDHAFIGGLPIFALDKVYGVDLASNQNNIFLLVFITAILTVIYWPLAYFIRRKYQSRIGDTLSLSLGEKTVAWINYLFLLLFFTGLMIVLSDPLEIVYGVPTSLKVLLLLPIITIGTTIIMIFVFIRVVRNNRYGFINKLCYGLLCVISILALWQLNYWNFIGYNY
jgi:CubicO group peptidase (beta-lactamase class C family)